MLIRMPVFWSTDVNASLVYWLPSKIVALGFVGVHLACTSVFLACPLLWLLFPGLRLQNFWRLETVFIYSLVGVNAVLQALVVQGENARFRVAVEPLRSLWRSG